MAGWKSSSRSCDGATIAKQYNDFVSQTSKNATRLYLKTSLATVDHCALRDNNASVRKFSEVGLHKLPWAFPPLI